MKNVLSCVAIINFLFALNCLLILLFIYPSYIEATNVIWGAFGVACLNGIIFGVTFGIIYDSNLK